MWIQGGVEQRKGESGMGWQGLVSCYACLLDLEPIPLDDGAPGEVGVIVRCPDCHQLFCFDCDAFIHETLHNCPGCLCLVDDDVAEDGTHDEHVAAMDEG